MEKQDEAEQLLLQASRNGQANIVRQMVSDVQAGTFKLNINCKGQSKANLGWSPLHLSSYFGHKDVVETLLEGGADVNILNDVGDTPLHRSAHTDRLNIATLLLQHNADVNLMNGEGRLAKQLTRNSDIKNLIQAAESVEARKVEEQYLQAVRSGSTEDLEQLLKKTNNLNLNCTDVYGNTGLHCAAYLGHKGTAALLLENGIDTTARNAKGQLAIDLARDEQMKQVLAVRPIRQVQRSVKRHEGQLLKRSRILGWKAVWIVLERGVLTCFRNRADATTGSKRKFCRYLDEAEVKCKPGESHVFSLSFSDHTSMTLGVEPGTNCYVKRQKWENALKDHISFSNHFTHDSGSTFYDDDDDMEELLPLGSLQDALQTAQAHESTLEKHVKLLDEAITENSTATGQTKEVGLVQVWQQLTQIAQQSREMSTSLTHCLSIFTQQEELRRHQLEQAGEKARVLQDALHILAEEHHELEQSLGGHTSPCSMYESDDDEFYECADSGRIPGSSSSSSISSSSTITSATKSAVQFSVGPIAINNNCSKDGQGEKSIWGGRTTLPVTMFSRNDFSVWSILKQCVGKELSKITMPVIFNEPISFLQRVVEYMEYAPLLDKASASNDPLERLELVTAYAVSATASNWERIGKPFNPLLGETYQLENKELGFKIICEQVCHHPPVSAFHADSPNYTFHGSVHPKLKFWGKSVEVTPKGLVTLHLKRHNEWYSWQNVNCCVHNIIVGKLWVEHYGSMEVTNHTTKWKSVLSFKPSGWFGRELHKVEGHVIDSNKKKKRAYYGKWIEGLYSHDVGAYESHNTSKSNQEATPTSEVPENAGDPQVPDPVPVKGSSCKLCLPGEKLLWSANPKPEDSTNKYYSFTLFAMMLNELTDEVRSTLAPTDCRLRPDIRKLEDGDIDGAGEEKTRVEEKQRAVRKERKKTKEEWKPKWFTLETNPHTGKEDWLYNGKFWDCNNFDSSQDIF